MNEWEEFNKQLEKNDLLRVPLSIDRRSDAYIHINDRTYLDFSSNDALGLGQDVMNIEAVSGSGASRLVTGNMRAVEGVEREFSEWMGFESALLFPSGWQANTTLMSGLFDKNDLILSDEFNHASLVDGMRLSNCRKKIFPHKDINAIKLLIDQEKPTAIVIESLYSVDGDFFPINELIELLRGSGVLLVVDEAHATGIYGSRHQGCCASAHIYKDLIKVATCSKALGAQGAFVLMSESCRLYLMNKGRGFIFSTGVSPVMAKLIQIQIHKILNNELDQNTLIELSIYFDKKLRDAGYLCLNDKGSHVLTIDFDSHDKGRKVRDNLRDNGVWTAWLRYPTVPEGRSRIRFSLTVHHKKEHIQQILQILAS